MELFLYGAVPDDVIDVLEDFGASREPDGQIWHYPNKSDPELLLHLRVKEQQDTERLRLGDTISTYVAGDLTWEAWQAWSQRVAEALDIEIPEASAKIQDADVMIRELNHRPATGKMNALLSRLLKTWKGFAYDGTSVLTSDNIHPD